MVALAGVAGLLAASFRAHSQDLTPAERAALVQSVQRQKALNAAAGDRIAQQAPVVFIGRPLTDEVRPGKTGRFYHTTVVQVLEVLRGAALVTPGTLSITDTIGTDGRHPLGRPPTFRELHEEMGHTGYASGSWGVYFCMPSPFPMPLVPYRTDNRVNLRFYESSYEAQVQTQTAFVMRTDGCSQETLLEGLGQRFASEGVLWEYLSRVAHVTPRRQPAASYPPPVLNADANEGRGKDYRTGPAHSTPTR